MFKSIILIIIIAFIISGCNLLQQGSPTVSSSKEDGKTYTEEKPDKKGSIVEIPKIAKLSKEKIIALLGKPKIDVKSGLEYSLNQGDANLSIDWKGEKISRIRLELKTQRDSSADLLKAGGFVLENDKPDWENAIVKIYKNRIFNGVRFSEIRVGMSPPTQKWEDLEIDVINVIDQ